jgi:hypothetical protein
VAVDRDATRVALARHNLGAGLEGVPGAGPALAVAGDAAAPPVRADVLFVDPDRRPGPRRTARLTASSPSREAILGLTSRYEVVLVKAPLALPDAEIPAEAAADFLSERGEAKEAFLRWGAGTEPGRRRAVRLPEELVREVTEAPPAPIADDGAWLLDPDPALRRAGGVDGLAAELGAGRVAPGSSYLLVGRRPDSPWVRAYRVIEAFSYRPRDLARRLAADPPRELVVKQRGVGLDEPRVRRGLPRREGGPRRVVVLHPRGKSIRCVLCEPPGESGPTEPGD